MKLLVDEITSLLSYLTSSCEMVAKELKLREVSAKVPVTSLVI